MARLGDSRLARSSRFTSVTGRAENEGIGVAWSRTELRARPSVSARAASPNRPETTATDNQGNAPLPKGEHSGFRVPRVVRLVAHALITHFVPLPEAPKSTVFGSRRLRAPPAVDFRPSALLSSKLRETRVVGQSESQAVGKLRCVYRN